MDDEKPQQSAQIHLHPRAEAWPAKAILHDALNRIGAAETMFVAWFDEQGNMNLGMSGQNRDVLWMLAHAQKHLLQ